MFGQEEKTPLTKAITGIKAELCHVSKSEGVIIKICSNLLHLSPVSFFPAGVRTHIWAYFYECFSLDQASEHSWGGSSPIPISVPCGALSQHTDQLPFGLSQARKRAPGAAKMRPHRSLAFVPHGQNTAHLNQPPIPSNANGLEVRSLAPAVLLSRSAHVGLPDSPD